MESAREAGAVGRLVGDGLAGVVAVVRDTHRAISDRAFDAVGPVSRPVRAVHDAVTGGVYAIVRAAHATIPRLIGTTVEHGWRPEKSPLSGSPAGRVTLGVVNGIWGDTLDARHPDLATPMALRARDADVQPTAEDLRAAFPAATPRIVVFVHGLCETEDHWSLAADRHHGVAGTTLGSRLRREFGYTPVYLRYNTGLHVSDNGRRLAALLEEVSTAWPVPVREISLIGHSMGGLVIRSAGQQAAGAGHRWAHAVRNVVFLGTPHLGAPLARGVHRVAWLLARFPESRPIGELLRRRSAGVQDLAYGNLVEADWRAADPAALPSDTCTDVPFLPGAHHYFIGATLGGRPHDPLAAVVGDLLVPFSSAAGRGDRRRLPFPAGNGRHLGGLHHLDLLNHPAVHDQVCAWLAAPAAQPEGDEASR
ncbi:esterase/lipase family protein [Actinoplanes sp. NPDC020271]|uniref:esterase/lipase family protein n=1 Tax=Actinoplanes sp. NPDC020271 TaxID=3363896 RepID=UPI0037B4F46B